MHWKCCVHQFLAESSPLLPVVQPLWHTLVAALVTFHSDPLICNCHDNETTRRKQKLPATKGFKAKWLRAKLRHVWPCSKATPLKINGWNIIMEVWFRSFSFPLWVICRFQPLIFQVYLRFGGLSSTCAETGGAFRKTCGREKLEIKSGSRGLTMKSRCFEIKWFQTARILQKFSFTGFFPRNLQQDPLNGPLNLGI